MPAEIVLQEGAGPFAGMLAGLLDANLRADPGKHRLVRDTTGVVGVTVSDTGEEVLARFAGGELVIGAGAAPHSALRLAGSADEILALSTVPLRFGLPDLLTGSGRGLTGRWLAGTLEIHGLPRHAGLLRTWLTLLNVLA